MTTAALVLPDSSSAAPAVHCLAGDASVAAAVVRGDDAMVLVAEDAGAHSGELADLFRALAGRGTPLGALAALLDEAITSWGGSGVMATLVDAHAHGFTVLHRGGPTPIVVGAQGSLTRIVAATPGPPLGPHDTITTLRRGEIHSAQPGDVLVLTTPSGIDDAISALASAAGPTWDDVRYALTRDGTSPTPQEGFALIAFR
ncbi:MAG: serine/threonine-protein phosphatase [Actinomycetia bacterium]|nr:serine/threonine-protein phosphatase [Actinomycetes bacterium]